VIPCRSRSTPRTRELFLADAVSDARRITPLTNRDGRRRRAGPIRSPTSKRELPATRTFHAQYRKASTAERNPYVILDGVKGRGRYVGTFWRGPK